MMRNLLMCGALCLPVLAHGFTGTINKNYKEGGVARSISMSNWHVDKRGVPSFDYRYTQSGPGCDYQRSGHAIAGFEETGSGVQLEIYNSEGDDGKGVEPVATFYDKDNTVILSLPMVKNKQPAWVSFEDALMKSKLPKKCGYAGQGESPVFK
jgi:hypothetical protein